MPKDPWTTTKKDNKEITNTKHPKQLNTETTTTTKQLGEKKKTTTKKKKRKTLTYAPKVKNNRAFPEEKTTFRKLSISFSNYLTVMNIKYTNTNKKSLY